MAWKRTDFTRTPRCASTPVWSRCVLRQRKSPSFFIQLLLVLHFVLRNEIKPIFEYVESISYFRGIEFGSQIVLFGQKLFHTPLHPNTYAMNNGTTAPHFETSQGGGDKLIAVVLTCAMAMFYNRTFSLSKPSLRISGAEDLLKVGVWYIVWYDIIARGSPHALLLSISAAAVQVGPARKGFKRLMSRFHMPNAAASLRQIMGPPFVLYTVMHASRSVNMGMHLSALLAIFGGFFARPDNDWADTHAFLKSRVGRVKTIHGLCMSISFLLNVMSLVFQQM